MNQYNKEQALVWSLNRVTHMAAEPYPTVTLDTVREGRAG